MDALSLASSRWLEVGASRMLGQGTFLADLIRWRGLDFRPPRKDALPDEVAESATGADVFREWETHRARNAWSLSEA